jgi:hypothetical protein
MVATGLLRILILSTIFDRIRCLGGTGYAYPKISKSSGLLVPENRASTPRGTRKLDRIRKSSNIGSDRKNCGFLIVNIRIPKDDLFSLTFFAENLSNMAVSIFYYF